MYLGIMEQAYSYQIQNLETKFIFALIIQSDTISNTKSQPYYKASVFLARICLMDPRLFNSGNTSKTHIRSIKFHNCLVIRKFCIATTKIYFKYMNWIFCYDVSALFWFSSWEETFLAQKFKIQIVGKSKFKFYGKRKCVSSGKTISARVL